MRCVFGALLVCFHATTVQAQVQTFNVDLPGTASNSGHQLSVFGTITLDPSLPVGSAIQSSNLHVQHLSDTSIAMQPTPSFVSEIPVSLTWSTAGNRLFIDRVFNANNFLTWNGLSGGTTASLVFASGLDSDNSHRITYSNPNIEDVDIAVLKPAGGVDAPNGFLVGTLIPEPSSGMFLAGLGAAITMRRRRRV